MERRQWIEASRIDWDTTKERLREVRERKRKYDEFTHESHEDHEVSHKEAPVGVVWRERTSLGVLVHR